jgi:RimJ/RimL family protein N-acetyltransferase
MANNVTLRDVIESDLPIFFEQQADPDANHMAAFPARDRDAFDAHWAKVLANKNALVKTIIWDGNVAGNIGSWEQADERKIGYWIGKEYWGKGIASAALSQYLEHDPVRPLKAHVVKTNVASIRVLQKSGFTASGTEKFQDPDEFEGEELVMTLEATA